MGREMLEGTVLDRNANFMASQVSEAGFRVRAIHVIDDVEEEAVEAFQEAISKRPDFIFVTGGLGPGHDDNTRECLAKAAGLELALDDDAKAHLESSYRRLVAHGNVRDAELTEPRLRMATIPVGAKCFENPIGTAPAIQLTLDRTVVFMLPGAPDECRQLFLANVVPVLEAQGPDGHRLATKIEFPGGDESLVSRMLADLQRRHPDVHSRARLQGSSTDQSARMRVTLIAEGTDRDAVQTHLDAAAADLRARLGLELTGPGEESFAE